MVWMISKARHRFCVWLISFFFIFPSAPGEFCNPGRNKSFAIHHWITHMIRYLLSKLVDFNTVLTWTGTSGFTGASEMTWVATTEEEPLVSMFTARERVKLHFTDLQTNSKEVINIKKHLWNVFDWRVHQRDSWFHLVSTQLPLIISISKLFLSNLPSADDWTDVSCCSLISNYSFCPTSTGQKTFFFFYLFMLLLISVTLLNQLDFFFFKDQPP